MCDPWYENRFPRFVALSELQKWVAPLIKEEELWEKEHKGFSGEPLPPNRKIA
jgi:hypothetical protein